jgi:hypothetical protein
MKASSRFALALSALLPLACVQHLHGPMTIPLTWSPTDSAALTFAATEAFKSQRVAVNPIVDAREDKTAIGKNIEEVIDRQKKPEWAVSTSTDVGSFLTERLLSVLQTNGVNAVTSDPTRVIRLEVARFFVTEGETYKAEVGLRVTIEDGGGRSLWQGLAEGSSNRVGRSYSPENYNEALCNAFLEAIKDLMKNPDMLRAVSAP